MKLRLELDTATGELVVYQDRRHGPGWKRLLAGRRIIALVQVRQALTRELRPD